MAGVSLSSRVEVTLWTAAVALGDAVAVALFAIGGELRHGGTLWDGVETFAQFGFGWVVAAIALRAYVTGALSPPRRAAGVALASWSVAVLLGGVIRVVTESGASLDPVFLVVSLAVGGVLLAAWRVVVAVSLE